MLPKLTNTWWYVQHSVSCVRRTLTGIRDIREAVLVK